MSILRWLLGILSLFREAHLRLKAEIDLGLGHGSRKECPSSKKKLYTPKEERARTRILRRKERKKRLKDGRD